MARIGIMGGTFDPIHNGHLMLGRQAYREYHLDRVWYMPSGQPPHKKGNHVTPAADRCAMVSLALEREEGLFLSEFETSRGGTTYTATTLSLLCGEHPGDEFYFIIGADSLYEIESWYHPERILAMAGLLVAPREYRQGVTGAQPASKYKQSVTGAQPAWEYRLSLTGAQPASKYEQCVTGALFASKFKEASASLDEQIEHLRLTYNARIEKLHCQKMDISSHEIRQAIREGREVGNLIPPEVLRYIQTHHLYQEEPADE